MAGVHWRAFLSGNRISASSRLFIDRYLSAWPTESRPLTDPGCPMTRRDAIQSLLTQVVSRRIPARTIFDGGGGDVVFEVGGVHHLPVRKAELRAIWHRALANQCRALALRVLLALLRTSSNDHRPLSRVAKSFLPQLRP